MVLVTIAKGDVMTVTPVETVKDVAITSYSTDYADADKKDEYKLTKLTAGGNKSAKLYELAGCTSSGPTALPTSPRSSRWALTATVWTSLPSRAPWRPF